MSRIDGLSEVMALLRRELQQSGRPSTLGKPKRATNASPGDSLERRVLERLRQLKVNNSDDDKKRTRIFLEAVIAWEFGDDLGQDPKFHEMITTLANTMDQDPQLRAKLAAFFKSSVA